LRAQFAVTADAHVPPVALRRSPRRVNQAGNLAPLDPEIRDHEYCAAILAETGPGGGLKTRYRSTLLVRQVELDGRPYLTLKMCAAILSKTGPGGGPKSRYRSTVPDADAAHKKHPTTG